MSKPATEVRRYPLQLRRTANRRMTGLAAPYGEVADLGFFREVLVPGVFAKSITEAARALPLLMFHDHESLPVGKAVGWEETDSGLIGEWEFDTRAEALEAARLADEGFLTGLSVGFTPIQTRWDDEPADGGAPLAHRVESRLAETSLVPAGAFVGARVLAVRSAGHPELPATKVVPTPKLDQFRAWLASRG